MKYGKDKSLEALANQLLSEGVGGNKPSIDRDIEKRKYELGLISLDELQYYDPANTWDTHDSAFSIAIDPDGVDSVESTICDADDNVRSRNPKLLERGAAMQHVGEDDDWGPELEADIPPLGVNGPRKACTKCRRPKGLSCFSPDPRNRDGLRSWCQDCEKESARMRYTRKSQGNSSN